PSSTYETFYKLSEYRKTLIFFAILSLLMCVVSFIQLTSRMRLHYRCAKIACSFSYPNTVHNTTMLVYGFLLIPIIYKYVHDSGNVVQIFIIYLLFNIYSAIAARIATINRIVNDALSESGCSGFRSEFFAGLLSYR